MSYISSIIDKGKSKNYAHAYADASNRHLNEMCWNIYAQAYELAKEKGMNTCSAFVFADYCSEAWANSLLTYWKSFKESYHEEWQIDFYISLMRHLYSESEINEILRLS